MAVTIASLAAKLSLDTRNFVAGFGKARAATQTFGQEVGGKVTSGLLKVSAAFLTVEKGIQLAKFGFKEFTEALGRVAETDKLAKKLGITYGQMQRLSVASKLTGNSVEDFLGGKVKNAGQEIDRAGRFIERFGLNMGSVDASKISGSLGAWRQFSTLLEGLAEKSAAAISPSLERSLVRATYLVDNMAQSIDRLLERFGGLANISDRVLGFMDQQAQHLANNLEFLADMFGGKKPPPRTNSRMPGDFLGQLADPASAKKALPMFAQNADRGSIEAARIIQGSSQANAMPKLLEAILTELKTQTRNADPVANQTRGVAPLQVAVI